MGDLAYLPYRLVSAVANEHGANEHWSNKHWVGRCS